MDQSKNEHTPVSDSDDEFGPFHISETKYNATGYKEEEGYAEEEEYAK